MPGSPSARDALSGVDKSILPGRLNLKPRESSPPASFLCFVALLPLRVRSRRLELPPAAGRCSLGFLPLQRPFRASESRTYLQPHDWNSACVLFHDPRAVRLVQSAIHGTRSPMDQVRHPDEIRPSSPSTDSNSLQSWSAPPLGDDSFSPDLFTASPEGETALAFRASKCLAGAVSTRDTACLS